MPPLTMPQQELYCRNLAAGMSGAAAYLAAGYKASEARAAGNAWRLRQSPKIAERVQELREQAIRQTCEELGVGIVRRVEVLREQLGATRKQGRGEDAEESPDWPARAQAVDLINRMCGVYATRLEASEGDGELSEALAAVVGTGALKLARRKRESAKRQLKAVDAA